MLHYLAVYITIAICYALIAQYFNGPLFIRSKSKHFPWKINYNFRWWRSHEWWAAAATTTFSLYTLTHIWEFTGGPVYSGVKAFFLALTCLSSTILSIKHYGLVDKFKSHSWWLTTITAFLTIFLLIISNAYSDSFILNTTRIDPSKFSLSQKAVSTAILVSLWTYITTLVFSFVVFANYLWDLSTHTHIIPARDPSTGLPVNAKDFRSTASTKRSLHKKIIVNIGAFVTLVTLGNLWGQVASQYNAGLENIIVFSSFHLKPKDCGIQGLSPDARIAPIGESDAVVATPSSSGYKFETVKCTVLSESDILKRKAATILRDDYI